MKLNGIQCDNIEWMGKDSVEFSLTATYDEASEIRAPLIVTDGDATVASFEGMSPMGVWKSGESCRLRASRELEADSKAAIHALEQNVSLLTTKATAIEGDVSDVEEANADVLQAIGELGVDIAGIQSTNADLLQAVGELGTMIASLSTPADDATE